MGTTNKKYKMNNELCYGDMSDTTLAIIHMNQFYKMAINDVEPIFTEGEFDKDVNPTDIMSMIPSLSLLCFSIELSFKILNNRFGKAFVEEHDLLDLYKNLPIPFENTIAVCLEGSYKKRGFLKEDDCFGKNDIENKLDVIKDGFRLLRYWAFSRERIELDIFFVYSLATISRNLAIGMSPQAKQFMDENKLF